ncbi:MAG: sigma 54-interacting transcriptional regulator, partial [Myxococcota bacterium]
MPRVVHSNNASYTVIDGSKSARVVSPSQQTASAEAPAMREVSPCAPVAAMDGPASHLIGDSAAMQAIRDDIARVARSGCDSVLITGETGTGKEALAAAIHRNSP